jgi:hypothetical protein
MRRKPMAEIQVSRCWVPGAVAELDALCAGLRETTHARSKQMAGEPASLMCALGSHGFDEAGGGLRIEPEQAIGRDLVGLIQYQQIEIGSVKRGLPKPFFDTLPASTGHVMR